MALRKPSDFFGKEINEDQPLEVSVDNSLREELTRVESLSEQISQLQQELSQKVVQTDLEKLVLSQINSMQENFNYLQNDFRQSNKKDIAEFKDKVSELTEIVGNLLENELPKYKRQVTKNELRIDEKFDSFKEIVEENILGIKEEVDNKVNNIAEVIDNNLEYFNNQLQENSSEVKRTTDTYNKLSKIVESKVSRENEKLEEYSNTIRSLHEAFIELESSLQEESSAHLQVIEEKFETISSDVNDRFDSINEEVKSFENSISSEVSNIKADVVINEQHIKNVDKYLQENHQELVTLREEVFAEIGQIPVGNLQENLERLEKKIDFIKETYSSIEPEVVVKEVIKEGILNIPPDQKTSDPLSPLNKDFVTLDQLQEHYRLFINRIQQQLSTLGGGGETRLEFLDDIDRTSAKVNGRFLKYDAASGKWIGALGGGGGSQTLDDTLGLGNTSSLGMSVGVITATKFVGVGTVGINSVFSTTDIQSWYYTNKSKNIGGDDATPQAIYIGAAGTAMFLVGDSGNDVNQYTLSTPYDVSTAGSAVTTFSVATQETNPLGIDFNPTGTKMFISGSTGVAPLIASGEYVHEYSLSTAWTVSSAGYTTSFNVTAQDTSPQGVTFGNSGSKMYVVGNTNDTIYQYSLSTPYSLVSGVTYDNISLILGTNPLLLETLPTDISFDYTGTVLWVTGSTNDRIYEFRLGTAWDISTAVFYDDVYIGFNEITVTGLQVIPEQNVAYIVGSGSDTVFQYSTNTPALEIASSGISSVSSIVLNNETRVKDKLYVRGNTHIDGNTLTQGTLTVDGASTLTGAVTASSTLSVTSTLTASAAVTFDTTTSNINLATSQTTGTLILGGTSQTGQITLGRATTSQTVGIATGVTASGNTKTINFGTGGASGSFTQINIGPTAGVGTVVINSGTRLGIGSTTPTSALTVQGDVRISGATTITGNLNAPGNYYVKLAITTNQTIPNNIDTLISFTVTSDANGWYSGITTHTTPTVAGTYRVDAMVNWQAGTVVNNQTNIQIRKNGSTFALHQVGIQTNFAYTQTACGIVTMNGTSDYIDFTVFTGNTTSQVVTGTADGAWTKMEIFKIN